jgi:uncharacterized membrane protein
MGKGRVEAFSDGVIAIIITIMVLELKVPHGGGLQAILPLIPTLLSYLLSFVNVGIYWNNHHHMFQAVKHVRGGVLWANLHLLFWLSLMPFATGWMDENDFAMTPVMVYGFILLMCGFAYYILGRMLIRVHGADSDFAHTLGSDRKATFSVCFYVLAILLAGINPYISVGMYVIVTGIWLVPDRRFERVMK